MKFEVRINGQTIGALELSDIERRASVWQKANANVEIIDDAHSTLPFSLEDFLAGSRKASVAAAPNAAPSSLRQAQSAGQFGSGPYFVRINGKTLGPLERTDIERRAQRWPAAAIEVAENAAGPYVDLAEFLRMQAPPQPFGPGPFYVRVGGSVLGPLQRDDVERRSRNWPATAEVAEAAAGPFIELAQFFKMAAAQTIPQAIVQRPATGGVHHPAVVAVLTLITLNFYWLFWLSRTYKRIRQINPLATKITPDRAWGFLFIPIFGAFWFVWIAYDLPRAILRIEGTGTTGKRFACTAATAMCFLGSLWVGGLGLPIRTAIPWIIGCEALFLGFTAHCQAALNRASQTSLGAAPTWRHAEDLLLGAAGIGVSCAAIVLYFTLAPDKASMAQDAAEKIEKGDFKEATELLEQMDSPEAEFRVATLYKDGIGGVKRDPEKAVSLLKDAAQAGLPRAETMLGLCYAQGEGVEVNPTSAISWYRKAASQGDTTAAELLGTAYAAGDGMDQDLVEAYMWFTVASNQGDEYAVSEKNLIGGRLDQSQRDQAERAAAELRSQ